MKFEIKNRVSGAVIFSLETETMRLCVEAAIKSGADLSGADLSGANLYGVYLRGANLIGADLIGVYLRGADLIGANLYGAKLIGANLIGVDLRGANLSGADLSGANLYGANLRGADLCGEKLKLTPVFISGLIWPVTITHGFLAIGCQRHTHEEWAAFDDTQIADMEHRAADFWAANKTWLLAACAAHRVEAEKAGE